MSAKPSRLPLIICLVGASIGLILAGGAGAAYFIGVGPFDVGAAATRMDSATSKYREAGLPWLAAELDVSPKVAEADNAAPLMRRAMAEVEKLDASKVIQELERLVDAREFAEAEAKITTFSEVLKFGYMASQRSRLDYKRDHDMSMSLHFPEFSLMRYVVRGFLIRAELYAATGRTAAALQDLRTARKIGWFVGQEPLMISLLVMLTTERFFCYAVQRCAYLWQRNPAALLELDRLVRSTERPIDLKRVIEGEAYHGVALIRNLHHYEHAIKTEWKEMPKIDPKDVVRGGMPTSARAKGYLAMHCEVWAEVRQALDTKSADLAKLADAMHEIEARWMARKTMSNKLNRIMFPTLADTVEALMIGEADRRATSALVSAMFQRTQGREFTSTAASISRKHIDPFTNKPLKVRKVAETLRFYSVGQDRVDGKGLHPNERQEGDEGSDVVASFPPRTRPTIP